MILTAKSARPKSDASKNCCSLMDLWASLRICVLDLGGDRTLLFGEKTKEICFPAVMGKAKRCVFIVRVLSPENVRLQYVWKRRDLNPLGRFLIGML